MTIVMMTAQLPLTIVMMQMVLQLGDGRIGIVTESRLGTIVMIQIRLMRLLLETAIRTECPLRLTAMTKIAICFRLWMMATVMVTVMKLELELELDLH